MKAPAVVGAAKIATDGKATLLGPKPGPDTIVTPENVQNAPALARMIATLFRSVAQLRARWYPRRIDFEDIPVGSIGALVQPLEHGFKGRVRWWVVGWQTTSGSGHSLREFSTTDTTLTLMSYVAGSACIRVEEAG